MADLMQQARELLATEYEKVGAYGAAQSLRHNDPIWINSATLKAISNALQKAEAAALRAAPEGFVLVPVVPTAAMERVLVDWLENNESSSGCYAALLAARPQGVKDGR